MNSRTRGLKRWRILGVVLACLLAIATSTIPTAQAQHPVPILQEQQVEHQKQRGERTAPQLIAQTTIRVDIDDDIVKKWSDWQRERVHLQAIYRAQRRERRSLYITVLGVGGAIALWGYGCLAWWFSARANHVTVARFADDPQRSHLERLMNSQALAKSSLGHLRIAAVHREGGLYVGIVALGMAIAAAGGVGLAMTLIRDWVTPLEIHSILALILYCSTGLVITIAATLQASAYRPLFEHQHQQARTLRQHFSLSDLLLPKEIKHPLAGLLSVYVHSVTTWLGIIGAPLYWFLCNDVIVAGMAGISSLYVSARASDVLRARHQLLLRDFVGKPYCADCETQAKCATVAGKNTANLYQTMENIHGLSAQPGPLDEQEVKAVDIGNVRYRACYCPTCEPRLHKTINLADDPQAALANSTTFYLQRLRSQDRVTCQQCRADTLEYERQESTVLRYLVTARSSENCHDCDYQNIQTRLRFRLGLLLWDCLRLPIVILNYVTKNA